MLYFLLASLVPEALTGLLAVVFRASLVLSQLRTRQILFLQNEHRPVGGGDQALQQRQMVLSRQTRGGQGSSTQRKAPIELEKSAQRKPLVKGLELSGSELLRALALSRYASSGAKRLAFQSWLQLRQSIAPLQVCICPCELQCRFLKCFAVQSLVRINCSLERSSCAQAALGEERSSNEVSSKARSL